MNHTQYITVSISVAVIVMIFSFPGIFEGAITKSSQNNTQFIFIINMFTCLL